MTTYKSIVTLTWRFDSDKNYEECLKEAKSNLESILNTNPQGDFFVGFTTQLDIVKMKNKKRLVHLGFFELDEVFPYVTHKESKKEFKIEDGTTYQVKMNSDRYHVFKDNNKCVSCGLVGSTFALDMNPGDSSPHFNLYAKEGERLVLMTKDHIVPKSKGGKDCIDNYQTMCSVCNNLKGAFEISVDDCRDLRILSNNNDKLPRKELCSIINTKRKEMANKYK